MEKELEISLQKAAERYSGAAFPTDTDITKALRLGKTEGFIAGVKYARKHKEKFDRDDLITLAEAIFYADSLLRTELMRMIDEGRSLTQEEYCRMVVDKMIEVVFSAEKEMEAKE